MATNILYVTVSLTPANDGDAAVIEYLAGAVDPNGNWIGIGPNKATQIAGNAQLGLSRRAFGKAILDTIHNGYNEPNFDADVVFLPEL